MRSLFFVLIVVIIGTVSLTATAIDMNKCCALKDWISYKKNHYYNFKSATKHTDLGGKTFVSWMNVSNAPKGRWFPGKYQSILTSYAADCGSPDLFIIGALVRFKLPFADGQSKQTVCFKEGIPGDLNCYGGRRRIPSGMIDDIRKTLCDVLQTSP